MRFSYYSYYFSKKSLLFIAYLFCSVRLTTQQTTASSDCNRFFDTSPSTFSSPGYPVQYSHNLECHYRAEAPEGNVVLLTFISFELQPHDGCRYDYVAVYDGSTNDAEQIAEMCGSFFPYPVYSTGKDMLVVFVTDGSTSGRGFEANFTFVDESSAPPRGCDAYVNTSLSIISSPGYPNPFSRNMDCTYVAETTPGNIIELTFNSISMRRDSDTCSLDSVSVYDGSEKQDNPIAMFCGNDIPSPVYSAANEMLVEFTPYPYGMGFTYSGFEAVFKFHNESLLSTFVPCELPDHAFIDQYESQEVPHGNTGVLECEDGYIPSTGDIEMHQCINGTFVPSFHCNILDCNLTFTSDNSSFTSPGYPTPYSPNLNCAYRAEASPGNIVELTFSSFSVYESDVCNEHAVLVYDGKTQDDELIATFCGHDVPHPVYSAGNTMLVTFVSNTQYGFAYIGFEALFTFIHSSMVPSFNPCELPDHSYVEEYENQLVPNGHTVILECDDGYIPSTAEIAFHQCVNGSFVPPFQCDLLSCKDLHFLTSPSTFTSPGYPNPYGLDMDCSFAAETVEGSVVKLSFNAFEVSHHVECTWHSVSVYDGNTTEDKLMARFCGNRVPSPLYSTGNNMLVTFKTDSYGGFLYNGFEAVFTFLVSSLVPDEEPCYLPENGHFEVPNFSPVPSGHTAVLRCDGGYLPPGPDTYQCVDSTFKPDLYCDSSGCSDYFTTSPSFFAAPGYPYHYEYLQCYYTAVAPVESIVLVTFTSFQMEDSDLCDRSDYVWVFDSNSTDGEPIAKFCGGYLPEPVYSAGNTMVVSITTDHYPGVGGDGFEAFFTFIDEPSIPTTGPCLSPQNGSFVDYPSEQVPHGHTVEILCTDGFLPTEISLRQCVNGTLYPSPSCNSTGCIEHFTSSPSFFSSLGDPVYFDSLKCSYSAKTYPGNVIAVAFSVFAVDKSELCQTDSVKVFDGRSTQDSQIATFCGTDIPCLVLSSGSEMLVTFTSNPYTGYDAIGFEATFTFFDNSTLANAEGCYPPEFAHFVSHSSQSIPHGHTAELQCDESDLPSERVYRQCCNGTFTPLLQCNSTLQGTTLWDETTSETSTFFGETTSGISTAQETTDLQTTASRVTTAPTTSPKSTPLDTTQSTDGQSTTSEVATFTMSTRQEFTFLIQTASPITTQQTTAPMSTKMMETTFRGTTEDGTTDNAPTTVQDTTLWDGTTSETSTFFGETTSGISTAQETTDVQTTASRVTTVPTTTSAKLTPLDTTQTTAGQSTILEVTTFKMSTGQETTSLIPSASPMTTHQTITPMSTKMETTFKGTTEDRTTFNAPTTDTTLQGRISSTVLPTIDPCSKSFNKTLGFFESPGNGSSYFNELSCYYETIAPSGKVVVLFFETFKLQPDPLCRFDVLKVYNGLTEEDELIAMLCGFEVPESVVSLGREMLVTFKTDDRKSYEGFLALFTFVNSSEIADELPCIISENVQVENMEKSMIPHSHTAVLRCKEGFKPEEPVNSQCVDGNFRPPLTCYKGESYLQRRYVIPHLSSGMEPVVYKIGFMDTDLSNTTFVNVQTSKDDNVFNFFGGVINTYEHILPEVFDQTRERSTIVIKSTNSVHLYVSTAHLKNQFFCYPTDWLDTDYIISTSPCNPQPSFIITATELDTEVSIFFPNDFPLDGDTYNFKNDLRRTFSELQSFAIKTPFDPTGTYIKASKPVAVMIDHWSQDCHTLDECSSSFYIPPLSKWATSYSFASSLNASYSFSITAAFDQTMVTIITQPENCGEGEQNFYLGSWKKRDFKNYNNCLISVVSNQTIFVLLTEYSGMNTCNAMVVPSIDRAVRGHPGVPVFTSPDQTGSNLRVWIMNGDDSLLVDDDQSYSWKIIGEARQDGIIIVETLVEPGYHVVSSSSEESRLLITVDKKLYAAYEDIEEQKTMCPFDRMYYSGVELTFSATRLGHSAQSMEVCKNSGTPLAARNCSNEYWEEPILLECYSETGVSEELGRLADEEVTEDNVDEVASEVALLTSQNPEDLSSTDVNNVADSLESIAEAGSTSPDVTNSLVGTVNNLMEVDEAQLEEAEDTNVVISSLEQQVSNVQKNPDNFTEVEDNVGVKAVKIDPTVTDAITFVNLAPEDAEGNERLYADLAENNTLLFNNIDEVQKEDTITSIYLPPKILQLARGENHDMAQVPFSFFIYKDSRLFQTNSPKEIVQGNMTISEEIVSQVIAATVENITVDDLSPEDAVITRFATANLDADVAILDRMCVFWEVNEDDKSTGSWSEEGCTLMSNGSDKNQIVCNCTHLTSFAVLFRVGKTTYKAIRSLELITIIGTSLSVAGLTACVLTLTLIKRLREKQTTQININLCVCLIAFYVTFLAGDLAIGKEPQCRIITTITHFFCLSTIAWTCAEAVNMYFLFVKYSRSKIKYFLPISCILCYGLPLAPALLVCFLDPTKLKDYCFLQPGPSLYYGLLLEILLMVIFNIVIFSLVVRRVIFRPMLSTNAQNNKKEEIIARMQQFILFWVLLGLSWVFGFLVIIPNRPSIAFEVLFCIFISLQGFILFLFICVKNPEVKKTFKKTKRRFTKKEGYQMKNLQASSSISDAQSKTDPKLTNLKSWDKSLVMSEESDLPGSQLAFTNSTFTGEDHSEGDELIFEESQKADYQTMTKPEVTGLTGLKEDQHVLQWEEVSDTHEI